MANFSWPRRTAPTRPPLRRRWRRSPVRGGLAASRRRSQFSGRPVRSGQRPARSRPRALISELPPIAQSDLGEGHSGRPCFFKMGSGPRFFFPDRPPHLSTAAGPLPGRLSGLLSRTTHTPTPTHISLSLSHTHTHAHATNTPHLSAAGISPTSGSVRLCASTWHGSRLRQTPGTHCPTLIGDLRRIQTAVPTSAPWWGNSTREEGGGTREAWQGGEGQGPGRGPRPRERASLSEQHGGSSTRCKITSGAPAEPRPASDLLTTCTYSSPHTSIYGAVGH